VVYAEFPTDAHDALITIHPQEASESEVKVRLDG
jgi:hypothetical protein